MKSMDHMFRDLSTEELNSLSHEERVLWICRPTDRAEKEAEGGKKFRVVVLLLLVVMVWMGNYHNFRESIPFFIIIGGYEFAYVTLRSEKLRIERYWRQDIYRQEVKALAKKLGKDFED